MQLKLTMSKSEKTGAGTVIRSRLQEQTACSGTLLLMLLLFLFSGCRRDMQDQPKMKPYRGTTFFGDGLSSRQPIEGTVARGFLRSDTEYYTGKKSKSPGTATATATPATQQQAAGTQANSY